jgi:hypothetical protein
VVTKPWVDPYPFVIRDTARNQVVARAATEALAQAYAKDSLDPSVPYTITKEKK